MKALVKGFKADGMDDDKAFALAWSIYNKKKKSEASILLGEILAKRAAEKKITKVYFDRGANKYHGRIKMFADSLRKNGLEF